MPVTPPVLELRQVVAGYPERQVLQDVSLTVAAGEVLAVLGPNGSGKSTLIRAGLGLLPLTRGTVALFGTPLPRFRQWRRVGYVPQRLGAGSGVPATVTEVVSSGRLARWRYRSPGQAAGPGRAAGREAVARAIAAVGLTDRHRDPVATLSGGQQQRVLIARALATEPDLLVLDEPTAGVDAASLLAFAATIRGFAAGGGTVVLVAHELGPLEELVSRAVVLHGGRVAHDGPVPRPAGACADWPGASARASGPAHDHVHPHAPAGPPDIWQGTHR
jgi:zinc transport system ATP-binding protein